MPEAKCDKAKNKIEIILDIRTVFMYYFISNLNLGWTPVRLGAVGATI